MTVPPGVVLTPPSLFVSVRSGAASTGVVSLAVLLPGTGSVTADATLAVLAICVTPAATGLTTVSAKVALPEAPPATVPTASVQVLPGLSFGAQTQPAVLAPALKVVFDGTVSVRTTPVAPNVLRFV